MWQIITHVHILKKHIHIVHDRHKDYKCKSCGESFIRARHLKNHIHTIHEGHKDYKCESCDKSFSNKGNLKKHIYASHEGNKDLKCVITEEDSCLSCRKICEDKYILDCGQQPFCNNCSENILSKDNRDCPVCNQRVSIRIMMRRQTKNT